MSSLARAYLAQIKSIMDQRLEAAYPAEAEADSPEQSWQAMRHMLFLGDGGKRFRSALCCAAAEACGGDRESALPYAQAIEEIHSYTLIEDDIMDGDDLRRGQATTHAVYGRDTALMAASRLYERGLRPFHRLSIAYTSDIEETLDMLHRGQAADTAAPHWPEEMKTASHFTFIQSGKTSSLFKLALLGGAASANTDEGRTKALLDYGHWLGLAFQARDDLLSATQTTESLGKPAGAQADCGKLTFLTLHGNNPAQAEAALTKMVTRAESALSPAFSPTESTTLHALLHLAAWRTR